MPENSQAIKILAIRHRLQVRIESKPRMRIIPMASLEHVGRLPVGVPEVPPYHPPDRLLARRTLDPNPIAGLKPRRPEQRIDQQGHVSGSSSQAAK